MADYSGDLFELLGGIWPIIREICTQLLTKIIDSAFKGSYNLSATVIVWGIH